MEKGGGAMRWVLVIFLSLFFVWGCAHKIAVMTLESTIQQAALAAKRGAGNASDKITIEVSVTNGYKGSGTAPIPVVPIGVEASLSQAIKLTIEVNLKDFPLEKGLIEAPKVYFLDLKNGALTEQ
jgi:hypothetical protein